MDYIQELKTKAPTLLMVLSGIVSYSDRRNKQKCGDYRYPGICTAAAVLLKEQNKHRVGLQPVLSPVMVAAQVDKLVRSKAVEDMYLHI